MLLLRKYSMFTASFRTKSDQYDGSSPFIKEHL